MCTGNRLTDSGSPVTGAKRAVVWEWKGLEYAAPGTKCLSYLFSSPLHLLWRSGVFQLCSFSLKTHFSVWGVLSRGEYFFRKHLAKRLKPITSPGYRGIQPSCLIYMNGHREAPQPTLSIVFAKLGASLGSRGVSYTRSWCLDYGFLVLPLPIQSHLLCFSEKSSKFLVHRFL